MDLLNLDVLPITKYENSLQYRKEFNLSMNSALALNRVNEELERLNTVISTGDSTIGTFNKTLESYLYTLLSANTFTNLSQDIVTDHFNNYQKLITALPTIPSDLYLSDILYTQKLTWGTTYGTIGYYLHLLEETDSYLHPSDIIYRCSFKALETLGDENYRFLFNKVMNRDDIKSDLELYELQIKIFNHIEEAIKLTTFLESYVPKLLSWYLNSIRTINSPPPPPSSTDPDFASYNLIVEVAKVFTRNLLDENSAVDLTYNLIHQTISPLFFSICNEVITLRKRQAVIPTTESIIDLLAKELIDNIPLILDENIIRTSSQIILETFPMPGGYNTLLTLIASNLVNRAYIISSSLNQNTLLNDSNSKEMARVYNLLYFAGYTLKKSSLLHLIIYGRNLSLLSGLPDDSPSIIKDLTE